MEVKNEFINGRTTMVQQQYEITDGLSAESRISKDPRADLPSTIKICEEQVEIQFFENYFSDF